MRSLRRSVAVVCAALAVVLTACGAPSTPGATAPAGPGSAVPGAGDARADPLGFTGATVDGGRFDGASLAGTPVLLWFWAPF